MNEFWRLDATAQAALVREKAVRPTDLVEAAIARIERLNPKLNAVVTPMFDRARAEAAVSVAEGPFTGVPFLMKDLLAEYGGVRFTEGSDFLDGRYTPAADSELTRRLRRAGLIVIGKTNTPELGILPTTEPRLFGPTHNPWSLGRTPGGSSGGSAAAVAAGLVAMAHANDGGGSIRIPASCCGLFGLKPTRGRNPLGPHYGDIFGGLVVEHVVTRSVRDSAAMLDATAGPDLGDPYFAPPPARPYLEEVSRPPGFLRVAFTTSATTGVPVHADCVHAVRDAAKLCEDLGHDVSEATPDLEGDAISQAFITVWSAGSSWTIDDWARRTGQTPSAERFEPLTWGLYEMGNRRRAADYLLAIQDLQRASRQIARFFVEYDVWLSPTLAEPPPLLGSFASTPDNPMQGIFRSAQFVPFTPIFNATGQPAMSVPLFWNQENVPIGVQFAGRFGDEATLFRLAAQLEQARPWAGRWPTL
ncbi:MAG: amidase [Candidatus Rokuibacteriota bacterium]|nr:MAG: amidase [Candidatus Rokubacteria bacterium]